MKTFVCRSKIVRQSPRNRRPRAPSSVLATLGTLQLGALSLLLRVDFMDSLPNYYLDYYTLFWMPIKWPNRPALTNFFPLPLPLPSPHSPSVSTVDCPASCPSLSSCSECSSSDHCMWCSSLSQCISANSTHAYAFTYPFGQCLGYVTSVNQCPGTCTCMCLSVRFRFLNMHSTF